MRFKRPATPQVVAIAEQMRGSVYVGAGDMAAQSMLTAELDPTAALDIAVEIIRAATAALDHRGGPQDADATQLLVVAASRIEAATRQLMETVTRPAAHDDQDELPRSPMAIRDGDTPHWYLVPLADVRRVRGTAIENIPAPAVVMGRDATYGWQRCEIPDGIMLRLKNCTVVVPPGVEPYPELGPGSRASGVTVREG